MTLLLIIARLYDPFITRLSRPLPIFYFKSHPNQASPVQKHSSTPTPTSILFTQPRAHIPTKSSGIVSFKYLSNSSQGTMSSVPSGVDVSSGWPLRRTRIKYGEEEGEDEVFFFFQSSKTTSVPIPGHIGYAFLSSQYWNLLSRCPEKRKIKHTLSIWRTPRTGEIDPSCAKLIPSYRFSQNLKIILYKLTCGNTWHCWNHQSCH